MRLTIVFPTLNEAAVIGPTLEAAIRDLDALGFGGRYEILVVDNASQDRTPSIIREAGKQHQQIRLVEHAKNLGYAMSNLTGFRHAKGEVIVVLDGDGQFAAGDIPAFLEKVADGYHIVYGWRKKRHDPPLRIVVSFFLNVLSRRLLAWPYHDINCGYRAMTGDIARRIEHVHMTNFFGPELWVLARENGWRVAEVPVQHFAREGGQSIHGLFRLPASILAGLKFLWLLRGRMRHAGEGEAQSCQAGGADS